MQHVSGRGEGEAYAYFVSEDTDITFSVGWRRFKQLGEPDTISVTFTPGRVPAAYSYSAA